MSPDSALGQLAQRIAKVEQRVDDLASRALERVTEIADNLKHSREETNENFRQFRPMIQDHVAFRVDLKHLTDDTERNFAKVMAEIRALEEQQGALEDRLDREERERIAIREAREEKEKERERERKRERAERAATEKRDKWARRIQTVAVALTFVSTSIAVAVFLLGQQRGR